MNKKKKVILITNDDGIEADGIRRLTELAIEFGEIWVVAPDNQRSACSHSITITGDINIYPYDFGLEGVKAFTCSGTPADCVRVGSLGVMPYRPDIVLSGINNGYNAATDIQYSGTCGAAFEAAFQGYHSIALSESYDGDREVADHFLKEIMDQIIDKRLGFGQIWNVNFPNCHLNECKGMLWDRTASHGRFFADSYKVVKELDNNGKQYVIDGKHVLEGEEGSDLRALSENYISIGIVNNVGL